MDEVSLPVIKNIVLTGGPCAGKTTSLAILEQRLTKLGYKVLIINEVATQVINSGISPEIGEDFQDIVIERQYTDYKIYNKAAKNKVYKRYKGVVIIHDRGILDNRAYVDFDYTFNEKLLRKGLTVDGVYSMYDGVIHLVTAARGAEKYYTLSNNLARVETIDEAIRLDKKIIDAWIGHPYLKIIDNENKNFTEKIDKLFIEVLNILGEPEPLDIKHKYLINKPTKEIINSLNAIKLNIEQTYLVSTNDIERRVRKIIVNKEITYYYTEKVKISNNIRVERGRRISEREYNDYLYARDKVRETIKKDRYRFKYKGKQFELDVYDKLVDIALLEIELLDTNEEYSLPDNIKVIKDVTNEESYKNYNIAKWIGL